MPKYLSIELKNGECKTYGWDEVDFKVTSTMLVVRELESGDLLFCSSLGNIEYVERIEEYGN